MARANLSAMLGKLDEDESTSAQPATINAAVETRTRKAPSAKAKAGGSNTTAKPKVQNAGSAAGEGLGHASGPLYMRLERKEARLRADQYAKLTEYSRRLSRARTEGGERITENTLIRVAIDLLLERADSLAGSNEAELRNSVSL